MTTSRTIGLGPLNRVSAIVVVGETHDGFVGFPERYRSAENEALAIPFAHSELIGRSPLQRTIDRLESEGVEGIDVVSSNQHRMSLTSTARLTMAGTQDPESAWTLAAQIAKSRSEEESDLVLVMRIGAYVEFSLDRLIEKHRDRAKGITRLHDQTGPLDIWLIDGERIRKCQHLSLVRELLTDRASRYVACSYVNRLTSAADLRRLAVDIILMRCATKPGGIQIKPGVWIEESAVIDRSARLVGPSYVGRNTRIRPSVLLTRLSHVESYCEIDPGTAIEDSSVLAKTYIGPSLDVTHAVVCGAHIAHLKMNVALEVFDPLLLSSSLSNEAPKPMKHRVVATQWIGRFIQTS